MYSWKPNSYVKSEAVNNFNFHWKSYYASLIATLETDKVFFSKRLDHASCPPVEESSQYPHNLKKNYKVVPTIYWILRVLSAHTWRTRGFMDLGDL